MSLPNDDAFLGVEHSISGRRWVARLDRAGEAQALAISQAHGIADVVARVLAGRGVGADNAPAYLNPTLRDLLPEPFSLRDMEPAATRLAAAIVQGERFAIFGDYDVDGACSAALLATFAARAGAPAPLIHIPDRIREGYGPNVEAVRDLFSRGARLMVAVDCGSTSFEALAEAQALGLETIVLDHHQIGDELPAGLVVNPNRQDDLSGAGALCAAGVVFLAIVATARELRRRGHWSSSRPEPDLLEALDLVALATVADVAPLVGLNRAFVTKGLAVMRQRRRVGLAALMDTAQLGGPPRPYDLGFLLGPRINAGGRIGDAALGARLLTMEDAAAAREIAAELNRLNAERRRLEEIALEEAVVAAERALDLGRSSSCLVLGDSAWRPGLVGLLASRLKDRFNIPSFVIAFNEESNSPSTLASCSSSCLSSSGPLLATGSGRSIPGVDLGRAVRGAVAEKIAAKGGGHAMAAGVTIEQNRLDEFRDFMNAALKAQVEARREEHLLRIDAALTARGAVGDLVDALEQAGPYGQGAQEPVFAFAEHGVDYVSEVGAGHIRLRLRSGDGAALDAICFRAAGTTLGDAIAQARGERFHFAARLAKSAYRGVAKVEAQVVDLASSRNPL
jgi:single-stranded-DNA-specific exonuclease